MIVFRGKCFHHILWFQEHHYLVNNFWRIDLLWIGKNMVCN
jgi:hypothetical protein